jgi:23S rRNA pseudouridine1911/1915/1917 synthase
MSQRSEIFSVESVPSPRRLDIFLHERYPALSRAAVQRLIKDGHVLVDNLPSKSSHSPRPGETIHIQWPAAKAIAAEPENIPLDVLFEDPQLVVLNKPPGLVVHPAAGHDDHTLVNALLHHCAGQLSGIGGAARPGIVHRLDKDTTGCLVVAKTDAAHRALAEQFAGRSILKIYHALVCGEVPNDKGHIHAAIARHPSHRKRMAVTDGAGREAWTSYRILERLRSATLVEAVLHTGRTHQIRVHFQHLGWPLVGDLTYGSRPNQRLAECTGYAAPRQMLHAAKLGLHHPLSGAWMEFHAPWPDDFETAVEMLAK